MATTSRKKFCLVVVEVVGAALISLVTSMFVLAAAILTYHQIEGQMGQLHFHTLKCNVDKLTELLQQPQADVNQADENGITPLHILVDGETLENVLSFDDDFSVIQERLNVLRLLVEHHCNASLQDNKGHTPLHIAAAHSEISPLLDQLLQSTPTNLSLQDNRGRTALHIAATANNEQGTALLLKHHQYVDIQDNQGRSALHCSVLTSSVNISLGLIRAGAAINIIDIYHETPLHLAARKNHSQLVELLLAHGADLSMINIHQQTALHLAIEIGASSLMIQMLGFFADGLPSPALSVMDKQGLYPLLLATQLGHLAAVRALLTNHTSPQRSPNGQGVLHVATFYGHRALVAFLIQMAKQPETLLKIDDVNNDGNTALHQAIYHGHEAIATDLVFYGARVDDRALFLNSSISRQSHNDIMLWIGLGLIVVLLLVVLAFIIKMYYFIIQ